MNRKTAILILINIIFVIFSGYFGKQYTRFKDRNMYHRSRMFEYEMMSNLYKVFPVGTPVEKFLTELNLDSSIIAMQSDQTNIDIDILPELPIPKAEQRDYSGFNVRFQDGKLLRISPVGPDVAMNRISLSELPIGKKIDYHQIP